MLSLGSRILIVGSPGAGKSTLARILSEQLSLPHYQLDDYYWKSGWVPRADAEWSAQVESLLHQPEWIIDGNYLGTLKVRQLASSSVILLDLPAHVCAWRALKRAVKRRLGNRSDLPAAVRLDLQAPTAHRFWKFLLFVLDFRRSQRPEVLEALSSHPNVLRLTSDLEIRRLVSGFGREPAWQR